MTNEELQKILNKCDKCQRGLAALDCDLGCDKIKALARELLIARNTLEQIMKTYDHRVNITTKAMP